MLNCPCIAPDGPPLNFSSVTTSSTSVLFQWSPPEADLQNGIIRHYTVKLEETETGIVTDYTSEEMSLSIEGLHPYYTYTCAVAAVTVASGPTVMLTFQLPQDGKAIFFQKYITVLLVCILL